ncbi:MAP kinase kinase Wis1 [Lecanicillium sp. MT-2017a]|nr:MAP kinase kinase Wis1 [Lecanicillium sp. MT-2017a]
MSSSDPPPATPDTDEPTSPSLDEPLASPLSEPPSPNEPQKSEPPKRMPSLRSVSENANLNPNSTALGMLGKARNPAMGSSSFAGRPGGGGAQIDAMKRAQALLHERMKLGSSPAASSPASPAVAPIGGASNGFQGGNPGMPPPRPGPGVHHNSAPAMPTRSLGERRANRFGGGGLKLSDMANPPPSSSPGGMKRAGAPKLSDMSSNESTPANTQSMPGTKLDDFKQYIDTEKGWITFDGAATITRTGVNFSNGQTFSISLDEVQIVGELGKGNYGTVYKVRHAKPTAPRFGHGLSGVTQSQIEKNKAEAENGTSLDPSDPKGKIMAMKEIRLELDDAKFTTILKELVILHECVSPYIIDFYGAFYQEGAVYMCIEYMDGGSIDKLYGGGMPENILRKVTYSTIMGLKCLKDDHSIIHRDVKPTNVLVNTRGQIKICDFGVSGNLVASIARTNIGCQSYMAPERISGGGMAQTGASDGTYSVQSDVWSLGLTIIECAMGRYPYPPEVSSTIFGQLNAIVEGEAPSLPDTGYSEAAHDFVASCVRKIAKMRPTYAMLLKHPWLSSLSKPETITEADEEDEEAAAAGGDDSDKVTDAVSKLDLGGTEDEEVARWVRSMLNGGDKDKDAAKRPALHAAPLVSPLGSPVLTTDKP